MMEGRQGHQLKRMHQWGLDSLVGLELKLYLYQICTIYLVDVIFIQFDGSNLSMGKEAGLNTDNTQVVCKFKHTCVPVIRAVRLCPYGGKSVNHTWTGGAPIKFASKPDEVYFLSLWSCPTSLSAFSRRNVLLTLQR